MFRSRKHPVLLLLFALGLGACQDDTDPVAFGDDAPSLGGLPSAGASGVTVMTRNLYLGADLDPVIGIQDPNQVPFAIAATWAQIMASDFPARAEALADEIAAAGPALVGLQEATTYRRQTPSDFVLGNFAPNASTPVWNFTDLLLAALQARGLSYYVAARVQNQDLEFPMYTGTGPLPFDDVRYTDEDVILARADIPTSNAYATNYAAYVPLVVGGLPIALKRGFVAVDTEVAGRAFRFVNTHLETQAAPPVQEAQAAQLIAWMNTSPLPVVAVGDFNSAANPSAPSDRKTASYGMLTGAGYHDVWARGNKPHSGLTCCHASDLRNVGDAFDQRIDLILVGQGFDHLVGSAQADVVGEELGDRTPSGLWPSDHAGLAAVLRLPNGR